MKRSVFFWACVLILLGVGSVLAAGDPNDMEGSSDPPLVNRMPGFHIRQYEAIEFDAYAFPVSPDQTQTVEGRRYSVMYYANDGIKQPSGLQVVRNYANAIKAIGGQQVYGYEDGGYQIVTLKIAKDGLESWAYVSAASNGMYQVQIIEKQAMAQAVVADAASMVKDIKELGSVSVYGIYFDSGTSVIKPESEPALMEIAKMMQADWQLKLYVVGHTDNVGALDYNITLSRARADAVVKMLVGKHAIAPVRLAAFGAGPVVPIASNEIEAGRAKNRRVGLAVQ